MLARDSHRLRSGNTSVLVGESPHGWQPPGQHCARSDARRQLRYPEQVAGLGHAPPSNHLAAAARSESDLTHAGSASPSADMDEAPHGYPLRRCVSKLSVRPCAKASYVESLCLMSHELHMQRCHSEGADDIFTIIQTPSKALAALMTPSSPLSAASTRPASPCDFQFSDAFPSSDKDLMGKIVNRACSLGGAALWTFLSLLLWCFALLVGLLLVLVLSLIAMSKDYD